MSNYSGHDRLYKLIREIQNHMEFDHSIDRFELIETHISYILLTGPYAYKFKKPLKLGFLDFSSLEKRKFYCSEEVRLNQRLSSELYIGVITITGDERDPVLNGRLPAIEYAVKMIQFKKGSELDRILATNGLTTGHIDDLSQQIATFHESIPARPAEDFLGSVACIQKQIMSNFTEIKTLSRDNHLGHTHLEQLEIWMTDVLKLNTGQFEHRKQEGYIRECHGDMHLGNIAMYKGKLEIFDCIEFSDELRWIDVISETAFLVMDLEAHGKREFAQRFLNNYLQITGDYAGLAVLRIYLVYHALIRSKVACIRLGQADMSQIKREEEIKNFNRYIDLANDYIKPDNIMLIITHGLSGSGKTSWSQVLADNLHAIRIRSDVERKRMQGIRIDEKTGSAAASGIYSEANTTRTYERLAELAKNILNSGYPVIVDAAFLKKWQRLYFNKIACELRIPFLILDFYANEKTLRDRIATREQSGDDASEANQDILEYQIAVQEPFDETEITHRIPIDSAHQADLTVVLSQINEKISTPSDPAGII